MRSTLNKEPISLADAKTTLAYFIGPSSVGPWTRLVNVAIRSHHVTSNYWSLDVCKTSLVPVQTSINITEKYFCINKNKPGPSTNMTLPTLKLYYIDPPKMGWPLKTMLRTKQMEKILTF